MKCVLDRTEGSPSTLKLNTLSVISCWWFLNRHLYSPASSTREDQVSVRLTLLLPAPCNAAVNRLSSAFGSARSQKGKNNVELLLARQARSTLSPASTATLVCPCTNSISPRKARTTNEPAELQQSCTTTLRSHRQQLLLTYPQLGHFLNS